MSTNADIVTIVLALAVPVGGGVAGITIVGSGAVAHSTSGHFRVRKTAADTFTIYRMS